MQMPLQRRAQCASANRARAGGGSGAEAAVTASSRARVQQLQDEGVAARRTRRESGERPLSGGKRRSRRGRDPASQLLDANVAARRAEGELRPAAINLPFDRVLALTSEECDGDVGVNVAAAGVGVEIDRDVRRDRNGDAAARGRKARISPRLLRETG